MLNQPRRTMKNAFDFPNREFKHWGAVAQEIISSLRLLGASVAEANLVAERMRQQWDPSVVSSSKAKAGAKLLSIAVKPALQSADDQKIPDRMNIKKLLALARFEYRRLSSH